MVRAVHEPQHPRLIALPCLAPLCLHWSARCRAPGTLDDSRGHSRPQVRCTRAHTSPGCAAQVRNLRGCIKVAVDFVAPESIGQCLRLTEERRELALREPEPAVLRHYQDKLQARPERCWACCTCVRHSLAQGGFCVSTQPGLLAAASAAAVLRGVWAACKALPNRVPPDQAPQRGLHACCRVVCPWLASCRRCSTPPLRLAGCSRRLRGLAAVQGELMLRRARNHSSLALLSQRAGSLAL